MIIRGSRKHLRATTPMECCAVLNIDPQSRPSSTSSVALSVILPLVWVSNRRNSSPSMYPPLRSVTDSCRSVAKQGLSNHFWSVCFRPKYQNGCKQRRVHVGVLHML